MPYQWFNFATGQLEWRDRPPTADGEARQYIPQAAGTQREYTRLRAGGASPIEAIRKLVEADLKAWQPHTRRA